MRRMELDEIINTQCEFGFYQQKVFWTIAGLMTFTAWQQIHNVYLGAVPAFICIKDGKEIDSCEQCDSYKFEGDDFSSIASEWQLVCDRNYLSNLVQSIFMGGILFGSVIFGWLADRYGRRHIVYLSIAGMGIFSLFGSFAHSYNFYVIMRLCVGIFCGGWGLVSFVLISETIGASKRGFAAMIMPIIFAIGIVLFALLAYVFRGWRMLTVITSLPGVAAVYLYMIVPESPRWLASQGRIRESERVLEMIITRNTGQPPKESIHINPPNKESKSRDSVLDLIKNSELRKRTLISVIAWFVNCAVYYGLTMGASNLGGDRYVSVALSGFVEIPAYGIGIYIINKYGRRHSITWTMVGGGIACLAVVCFSEGAKIQTTVIAMLGKMLISISFSIAWCYSAELYPTSIRNQGMSICNMSARLGGIVSPMLMQLSHAYPSLDYCTFGIMSIVAGFLCLKLPETLNQHMSETVDDLQKARSQLNVKVKNINDDKLKLLEQEINEAKDEDSDYEVI